MFTPAAKAQSRVAPRAGYCMRVTHGPRIAAMDIDRRARLGGLDNGPVVFTDRGLLVITTKYHFVFTFLEYVIFTCSPRDRAAAINSWTASPNLTCLSTVTIFCVISATLAE